MNWTIFCVIAATVILIPAALFATFANTRDTHRYAEHYGKHGFTQETQAELEAGSNSDEGNPEDPPIVDWPNGA